MKRCITHALAHVQAIAAADEDRSTGTRSGER
jgi:hypothetical protein